MIMNINGKEEKELITDVTAQVNQKGDILLLSVLTQLESCGFILHDQLLSFKKPLDDEDSAVF
jgi:hypothetical protein